MKRSIRVFISGSVQGIFFRQFIKDNAEKNKVKGYVRNLDDGRVEVFLEGELDSVNNMLEVCKRGPPHSLIRESKEQEEKFQDFKEFKIMNI